MLWIINLTEKIPLRLRSDGLGRQNMEKCLIVLGVIGFLPPPGGAHAAQRVISWIFFQNNLSLS